jgi:hypothetical protein
MDSLEVGTILKKLPNRAYYQEYANDFYATKKFNKPWSELSSAQRSEIANPSPVVYDQKYKKI